GAGGARACGGAPARPPAPGGGGGRRLSGVALLPGTGAVARGGGGFAREPRGGARPPQPVRVQSARVQSSRAQPATPLSRAVSLLASPQSERLPLAGSVGRLVLVLDDQGRGLIAVRDLGPAPAGRAYEAWMISPGARPV